MEYQGFIDTVAAKHASHYSKILPYKKIVAVYAVYKFILMNVVLFFLTSHIKLSDNVKYTHWSPHSFFTILIDSLHNVTRLSNTALALVSYIFSLLAFHQGYLINLYFNALATLGVLLLLKKLQLKDDFPGILFLVLLFTFSFNLFSSIASKECIVIFLMSFVLIDIIGFFQGDRKYTYPKIRVFIYFFLLLLKPFYILFFLPLECYILADRKFKFNLLQTWLLILFSLLMFINVWYFGRIHFHNLLNLIYQQFHAGAATRDNLWAPINGFMTALPESFFISLWGPLPSQVTSFSGQVAFIESLVVFSCLGLMLLNYLFNKKQAFNMCYFVALVFTLFLLGVAQTFYGMPNAGAAIRYRTDIFLAWIVLVYCLAMLPNFNRQRLGR